MCQGLAYNIHVCSLMGLVGPVRECLGRGRSGVDPRRSDDMVTEGKK